jgi:hypothetical protein
MRNFWWAVTFVAIWSIPSAGYAQWPGVGYPRQGYRDRSPVNQPRDPFGVSGIPGFPRVDQPWQGYPGRSPINDPRDPFGLAGMPGIPRVPTPADIANYRGDSRPETIPRLISSGNPTATPQMSQGWQQTIQIKQPKLDPQPSFPIASLRRWLWIAPVVLAGIFRALFKERSNKT